MSSNFHDTCDKSCGEYCVKEAKVGAIAIRL